MDDAVSDHNGDYLQRRLYALPCYDYQHPTHTLPPKMATHAGGDANGVPHGNVGMCRVWTRSFTGDDVRLGTCDVVRDAGERVAVPLFPIYSRLDRCHESTRLNRLL